VEQLYIRPVQESAGYPDHKGPSMVGVAAENIRPCAPRLGGNPADMMRQSGQLNGENCTIMLTDVVAFSSPSRTNEDQRIVRDALYDMTCMMLQGIADVRSESRGDGILTVVPPSIPTADVLQRLLREMLPALRRHNSTRDGSARFQLRVAVNVGPVTTDTMGVSGKAIIIAARLLAAPLFKKAMDTTGANLGVIASTFVYEAVLMDDKEMRGYSQVRVHVKEFNELAWMKLFDEASLHSDPKFGRGLTESLVALSGDLRHWLEAADQRVVTGVFGSSASLYLAAVRAAVPSAQRLVVTRPSRKTVAPQPARSSQAA
jgi:class 3 adenylate cyclase